MTKRCKDYVGVSCVDGSCPVANAEEYEERCMDVVKDCNDCHYYKGCEDCALDGTEYCEKQRRRDVKSDAVTCLALDRTDAGIK